VKSHFRSQILIIVCACLFSIAAIADEKRIELSQADKDKLATTARKLALCGGVYDMASEIYKATNSPALSSNTHEIANGAGIASAFLLASTGIIPDWQNALKYAENTRNSEKTRQAALLEIAGNSKDMVDKSIGDLTEATKECNILSDLQAELVQQAKLWMYANQPKK
jgi:hypothetical protein